MFELHKVGAHTYYIDAPTNMGLYVYEGNKVCMIDAGIDSTASGEALRIIREQGWTLTMVLNTHCHADHTGGSAFLKEQTGCIVCAPSVDAAVVSNSILNPAYLYGGFPMNDLLGKFLYFPACECLPLAPEMLPEGLSCVHMDGHSFEMVAVRTEDDVWFVADTVISAETLSKYRISFLLDIGEHLRSLDRLEGLSGKLFIPSHCPPVEDITGLVKANRDAVNDVADKIRELCRDGMSIDDLIAKLFEVYGIKLYLTQYALIGCTTRSYLSWMIDRGEITPVFEGTKLMFRSNEK